MKYLRLIGDAKIRSTPNSGKGTLKGWLEFLISMFSSQKLYGSSSDKNLDVAGGEDDVELVAGEWSE